MQLKTIDWSFTWKIKAVFRVCITLYRMSISKIYLCEIYGMSLMVNSVMCLKGGKLIYDICAGVKIFQEIWFCCRCKRNVGVTEEQDKKLCSEWEAVKAFAYLGDMVSADGGCDCQNNICML